MALSPNKDGAYLILKLYEVQKMLVLKFFDNATHTGDWCIGYNPLSVACGTVN
jgi:hypothetical protein